jgi:hypothetical protein
MLREIIETQNEKNFMFNLISGISGGKWHWSRTERSREEGDQVVGKGERHKWGSI